MALDIYSLPDKVITLAEAIFPEQDRFENWYNKNVTYIAETTDVDWDKMVADLEEYRDNERDGDEM